MAVRSAVLAFCTICIFAFAGIELATWNTPYGPVGWNLAPDASTVTYITRDGPMDGAGVRVGDKVDFRSMPLVTRANAILVQQLVAGQPLTATIVRDGRARTVTVRAGAWGDVYNLAQHISHMSGQLLALFAVVLVFLRPSVMTWGFLLSTLVIGFPQSAATDFGHRSSANYLIANLSSDVIRGLSAAGILIFVSRFPYDKPRGALAILDRAAPYAGALVFGVGAYVVLQLLSGVPPAAVAVAAFQTWIDIAITVVAFFALLISAFAAAGSERQRVIPVLAAYAFFVFARTVYQIERAAITDTGYMALFFAVMTAATLALAAAVAYGVIRHRVIDVSFAVSRTVVYTILTGIVVALFTLVDFVSSKFLEHLQFTIVLEAAAALAFGLWLNTLHSRVDRFVDRVLFRQRHLAEERLKRAARTLAHGDACDFVDDMLVLEATDALSLASAAVFREDAEGIYRRTCARGWQPEDCSELHTGDHLMVTLRAELRTIILRDVRLDDAAVPEGLAHPLLAVPLVVRHRPIGVVFYSGHTGGEAIDADEKRVLEALCEAAAGAYEHIRAAEIVREADGLRAENSVLKHDTALLREVLDGLRAPQPRKAPGARIEEKVI